MIKLKMIVIIQGNLEELLIIFVIQDTKHTKKIPVIFHNGSTNHLIINQLAKEFKGQLECLRENT